MPRVIRPLSIFTLTTIALFCAAPLHAEDTLASKLQNPDVTVRKAAIVELEKTPQSAAEHLPELIAAMKDKNNIPPGVTQSIFRLLENSREDLHAVALVIVEIFPVLDEPSQNYAIEILLLNRLKSDQALPFYMKLVEDPKWQRDAAYLLMSLGHNAAPAIPALEAAFQQLSEDKVLYATALSVIAAPRAEFVPLAKRALQSADEHIQSRGISLASHLGPFAPEVFPELIARLENSMSVLECSEIVEILATSPAKAGPALPALCKQLRRQDSPCRDDILKIFQTLGPNAKDAAPTLRDILAQEETGFRREEIRKTLAAIGLPEDAARIGPPQTPEALVAALGDPDRSYSDAAEKALKALGDNALPALREGLKHPDGRGRQRSVCLLFQCKGITSEDCIVLAELIQKDPAVEVRHEIAERLNRVAFSHVDNVPPEQRSRIALLGLKDPDAGVRSDCIGSLGGMNLEYKRLLQIIQGGLRDPSPTVQNAAYSLISSDLPKPCDPSLYEGMLAFAASRTSKWGLFVFPLLFEAGIPAKQSLPVLTTAVQDSNPDLGVAAVETLAKYGVQAQPATDVLLARIKTGPVYIQIEISKTLSAIRGPSEPPVAVLREIIRRDPASPPLENFEFRDAVDALGSFKEKAASARPELIAALPASKDREVDAVLQALDEIQIGSEAEALSILRFSTGKNDTVRRLALSIVSKLHPLPTCYLDALKTEIARVDLDDKNGGEILELTLLPANGGPSFYRSLFQHKNPVVRSTSALMLARYSPLTTEIIQSVLELAEKDPDPSVRKSIIISAFENRKKAELSDAIPLLQHIARTDPDKSIRLNAREALREIEFEK